jgi:hypothetical protein
MVASRASSGRPHADILVTGRTTAKKALASNITKKATNTRGCGLVISVMVKEPTGETKAAS